MKFVTTMTVVLLICNIAPAQTPDTNVPDNVLKGLEFMVGNWRTVMTKEAAESQHYPVVVGVEPLG